MRVLTALRKSTALRNIGATVSGVIDIEPLTRVATTTAMSGPPTAMATATYGHDGLCAGRACGARRGGYRLIGDDAHPAQRGLR